MRKPRHQLIPAALLLVMVAGCTAAPASNGTAPQPQLYPSQPGVGAEVDTAHQPQSTFAIDVDTASYAYARRQLLDGHTPDPATIRPEEFVNAFRQDYRQPPGKASR
jgi:Ca-activated chloride channel family protein